MIRGLTRAVMADHVARSLTRASGKWARAPLALLLACDVAIPGSSYKVPQLSVTCESNANIPKLPPQAIPAEPATIGSSHTSQTKLY
ncbi:hypothetical protein VNO77_03857 [Canavalia gladiata]|uniref:Uncharacterized protein n=1 Tax=Canavalia gladiata TaxID=3824 RepID=A0AAN9R8I8_CANGL